MSIKCHSQQTDKAGEWQHARNFQYPQTKTMLLEMGLDALDYGIALCACQRSRKISHHISVGIHRSAGCQITFAPAPQTHARPCQERDVSGKVGLSGHAADG